MTLRDRVRELVEALPSGDAVTLSRSTLREWLREDVESGRVDHGGDERWYSTSEVAELRGVKAPTVATWCANGRFPNAQKTGPEGGGEWRIPEGDLHSPDEGRHGDSDRVRFDPPGRRRP